MYLSVFQIDAVYLAPKFTVISSSWLYRHTSTDGHFLYVYEFMIALLAFTVHNSFLLSMMQYSLFIWFHYHCVKDKGRKMLRNISLDPLQFGSTLVLKRGECEGFILILFPKDDRIRLVWYHKFFHSHQTQTNNPSLYSKLIFIFLRRKKQLF